MSTQGGGASAATVDQDIEVRSPQLDLLRRFVAGDLAELRVVIALVVIWLVFYLQEPRFLSSINLTNLVLQMTAVGLVSIGVVLVLLLGEIDLSVGAVSGLCAAIMAVLAEKEGLSPYLAIAAAVAAGAAIGLFQGSVFTRFGVPSFVVTLAGLLAWPGAQLEVLGSTGTVNINDSKITGLTSTSTPTRSDGSSASWRSWRTPDSRCGRVSGACSRGCRPSSSGCCSCGWAS